VGYETGRIGPEDRPPAIWRAVAELAATQHGVVSLTKLRRLGISSNAAKKRTRSGHLHRLHRGVYAVGHRAITKRGRYLAAVLAAGLGAALSHRAAADLWGLRPSRGQIEVTVPRGRKGPPGVTVHRSYMLEERDFTIVDGIRVTTVARTLLDLAGVVSEQHLARAVDRAERLEWFDLAAIEDLLLRARGKRGAAMLRRVVAEYRPLNVHEGLEELFAALVKSGRRAQPQFNAFVDGERKTHQVDAYWPEHRLVVELDSYAFHRSRADLKRDADKQADLELAGHRVTRLTWDDVVTNADRTLRRLHRLLSQKPVAPKPFAAAAR